MHGQESTRGRVTPEPVELEQVLLVAVKQLPIVDIEGYLVVRAEVLPYALGRVRPHCSQCNDPLPSPFVWVDEASGEVFCHLYCACKKAVQMAESANVQDELR